MRENNFSIGEKIFVGVFSLAVFMLIILLTVLNEAPVARILLSFSPLILVIISVVSLFLKSRSQFRIVSWILPIFWPAVFYMMGVSGLSPASQTTEVGSILALNFALSFIFVLVLEIMVSVKEGFGNVFNKIKVEMPKNPKPENVKDAMQSIEDKSKALNQVIGRVYRRSNGANLKMRNLLKIKPELYNKFSRMTEENLMENPDATLNLLWHITDELNTLYLTEEEVFGDDSYKLRNLARDPTGKTKIIDVLIANDSDPAALYFKSSLEFCKKAIEEVEMLKNK